MANDPARAMGTRWSQGGYRALETVKSMRPSADDDIKALVVLIAAHFTGRHKNYLPSLPEAEGLGAIQDLKVAGLVSVREGPEQSDFPCGPGGSYNREDPYQDAIAGIWFRAENGHR